jgi:predicted nucleic acid-binding protein
VATVAEPLNVTVLFDTSTLLLAIDPGAKPPLDPATNQPLEHAKRRVEYLIRTLSKDKAKVLIPAPVLAEVLVHAGSAANDYVQSLQKSPFRVAPFDTRAAIEWAAGMERSRSTSKRKAAPWAKVKFDHQIVAVAKVEDVETIYSDDGDIYTLAKRAGLNVVRSSELPLDPDDKQLHLRFEEDGPSKPSVP